MKTDELKKLVEAVPAAPWRWELNRRAKGVELTGDNGDLTVMDFVRWGMSGAAARFWRWSGKPRTGDPKRADELAIPIQGREHHADWCAEIDDPAARLIAAAPTLAREVIALREAAGEAVQEIQAARDEAQAEIIKNANDIMPSRRLEDLYLGRKIGLEMAIAALATLRAVLGESE
jgi:hypothetical protein